MKKLIDIPDEYVSSLKKEAADKNLDFKKFIERLLTDCAKASKYFKKSKK